MDVLEVENSKTDKDYETMSKLDASIVDVNWTNASSGPKSITRTIKQDRKGNIWMASWEGIFKYDGNTFVNMTSKVSLSRFFSVLEDSKGNFWFGSIGSGVYYYDGNSFRNFTTKEGLVNDVVKYITEDRSGNIWFATQGGASYYDGKSFHNFTTKEGLLDDDTNWIMEDKFGKIWFTSRVRVSVYDGKKFSHFTQEGGQPLNNIRSIIEDQQGKIWLGGESGMWRYDGHSLTNITKAFVGYIYEDKAGSIWVSSHGGKGSEVIRYDRNVLYPENVTPTQIWTHSGMIFGILEDSIGRFWFGTLKGVCIYDNNSVNCP
jgi:ligand-binding sensor domain-containing protein